MSTSFEELNQKHKMKNRSAFDRVPCAVRLAPRTIYEIVLLNENGI
jgi:hypothetical protein